MNDNIKKNVYFHEINTTKLNIPNINNNDFQKKIMMIIIFRKNHDVHDFSKKL